MSAGTSLSLCVRAPSRGESHVVKVAPPEAQGMNTPTKITVGTIVLAVLLVLVIVANLVAAGGA